MLSERERKLLDDFRIVDRKPDDPPPTWREKLRFHRYLRALLKAPPLSTGVSDQ